MSHQLSNYNYELPKHRIAKEPLARRDESKLLFYSKGELNDHVFNEITELLPEDSCLVFNNTRVVQARLIFYKETGARIELFCLEPHDEVDLQLAMQQKKSVRWQVMIGNKKRWKEEQALSLEHEGIELKVEYIEDIKQSYLVEFQWSEEHLNFAEILEIFGRVPLPPYLGRPDTENDKIRYQTVYARNEGAVAAPTAGLHFTEEVMQGIRSRGIPVHEITLHVGAGTFKPVETEDIRQHEMHKEQVVFTREQIESLFRQKGKIINVGTTSLRALESLYWYGVKLQSDTEAVFEIAQNDADDLKYYSLSRRKSLENVLKKIEGEETLRGETNMFIHPGYKFRMTDGLITNFHLPKSTLIMLIAAFVGNNWHKIYEHALANNYRFLSYGDSSLLLP